MSRLHAHQYYFVLDCRRCYLDTAQEMTKAFTSELIPGLTYIDEFITSELETSLLSGCHRHPKAWKTLNNRTLQNWGGLPHIKGMLPTGMPDFLHPLLSRLTAEEIFPSKTRPNHVLVNRYMPGQGIDAHVDGPAYQPTAAIISLSAPIVMEFYERRTTTPENPLAEPLGALLLRRRSLLVLSEDAYHNVYHAIAERTSDQLNTSVINLRPDECNTIMQRQQRVSLTVRTACKTIKNPLLGRTRF